MGAGVYLAKPCHSLWLVTVAGAAEILRLCGKCSRMKIRVEGTTISKIELSILKQKSANARNKRGDEKDKR